MPAGDRPPRFCSLAQFDDFPTPTGYLDLGKLKPDAAQGMAQQIDRLVREQVGLPAKLGIEQWQIHRARGGNVRECRRRADRCQAGAARSSWRHSPSRCCPWTARCCASSICSAGIRSAMWQPQPVAALLDRFGKPGRSMHRLASGNDTRPVGSLRTRPWLSAPPCSVRVPPGALGAAGGAAGRDDVRRSAVRRRPARRPCGRLRWSPYARGWRGAGAAVVCCADRPAARSIYARIVLGSWLGGLGESTPGSSELELTS